MNEEFVYVVKDAPNKKYNSEEELKEANPEVCEPGKHVWTTTFSFGVFDCKKCEARKK